MPLTRRQLLRAASIAPIGLAIAALVEHAGKVVDSAAAALRPPAFGTSATRCAACGGRGHTMLDPRCPAARRVI